MLARQNQFQTAAPRFRHALDVYEKIAAADPERMQVKILAARARASLGDTLAANGNIVEAVRHLQIAVDFYESINAGASLDAHLKRHFAEACAFLGAAFAKQKNPAAARQFYRRSLELWRDLESKGVLKHSDLSRSSQIARLLAETNGT
jgi:tetratricopeptide (TPR) repeat protein